MILKSSERSGWLFAEVLGFADEVGVELFTLTPLFQINLLPDLIHVNLMPETVEVIPNFLHAVPLLTAALAASPELKANTKESTTAIRFIHRF